MRLGGSLPSSLTKALRKGWLRKSACARTTALLAFFVLWARAAGGDQATDRAALSAASSCKQHLGAGYIQCIPDEGAPPYMVLGALDLSAQSHITQQLQLHDWRPALS